MVFVRSIFALMAPGFTCLGIADALKWNSSQSSRMGLWTLYENCFTLILHSSFITLLKLRYRCIIATVFYCKKTSYRKLLFPSLLT
uniref:Uncharacterized protein n=1 Tax=Anopheles darlingi TaxID=43151 RepID=A0A2M4DEN4_ANODA